MQTAGLDYDPEGTYSPMTEPTTLRLILSIANALDLELDHLDIKTAYLNAKLPEKERFYCHGSVEDTKLSTNKQHSLSLPTSRIQGPSRVRAIRDKGLIRSTPKRRSMVYNLQGIHEGTRLSIQGSRQREVRIHHARESRRYTRRPRHRKRDLARGRREISNHSHEHGRYAQCS